MNDIINPYMPSLAIPENTLNLLALLSTNSWGMHTSAQYYNPSEEIPNENIIKSMGMNFYFRDFFESDSSPDINLTYAAMKKLIKNEAEGFIDNIVREDGLYHFLSDDHMRYFNKLMLEVSIIEDRYLNTVRFLKYAMNDNINNTFTPYDIPTMNLGKKNFFKEFTQYVKIIPRTSSDVDFSSLITKIKQVLLEDGKVKSMSHWELYTFQKYYLSFAVDDETLDEPYVKLYARDVAEAANLSFILMDKEYVEIL